MSNADESPRTEALSRAAEGHRGTALDPVAMTLGKSLPAIAYALVYVGDALHRLADRD
jgi:hypothetical protein